ncbi:MAG: D-2-hydroxyacid dehydrogenase [Chloroflexota bacterium]
MIEGGRTIRSLVVTQEANLTPEQLSRIREAAGNPAIAVSNRQTVLHLAPQAEVLAGMDSGIPREVFKDRGTLRWVHLFHAGADQILCDELVHSNIVVTSAKGAHAIPIAEHAFGFMLAHEKEFARHREAQAKAIWDRRPLGELADKTVCIVGLGNIGREIARRAQCFGMRVVGTRRTAEPVECVDVVVPVERLNEALAQSDYVVLTLPITGATQGMLGKPQLEAMKPGAVLINMCRGKVVDQKAMIEALKSGHLGGAALDATDPEPLPAENELWRMPNVMITPHNSAMSRKVRERSVDMFCANLLRYRQNEPLHEIVDKTAGY